MRLPAFEIEQNGKKFYAGYMLAQQLCDEKRVKADAWSPGNRVGYLLNTLQIRITFLPRQSC